MSEWTDHLPVNEVFGPVVQGEGPYTGRVCSFVRLGWCNLHCTGCDTAQTWDRTRYDLDQTCPPARVEEIAAAVHSFNTRLTIISGGEPLLWQHTPALLRLLYLLRETSGEVHFETNGTIAPAPRVVQLVDHFTVSPKIGPLAATCDPEGRRIKPEAITAFRELAGRRRAAFKFPCSTVEDVLDAAAFTAQWGLPSGQVWVMPYADTTQEVLAVHARITGTAIELGMNISTRLHLLTGIR